MRLFGGLAWPEDGNNGFICFVTEKTRPVENTMEKPVEYLEIIRESSSPDIMVLFQEIKDMKHLQAVYASGDSKYQSFIREYAKWRRSAGCNVFLRAPQISSFEAGVLKIKDYTSKNTLFFPEGSMVKSQLMVFSKLSIRNPLESIAVLALTKVISAFSKKGVVIQENEPNISSWY